MLAIIFISLLILCTAYFSGRLIKHFFLKEENYSFISIGFFGFLGILQFFTYFLVALGINTQIMLVTYLLVMILIVGSSFILKISLKPDRNDLISLIFGIIILVICLIRIQNYTLGESYLDSTFYLSMVNENSSKLTYGGMDFYSGKVSDLDFIYDYGSFYALFSMLLKLVRNLNISETMTTPIYFYASTTVYLSLFGITLITIIKRVLKNDIYKTLLFLTIASFIFFKYYHYALAFIGNSYRVMGVSLAFLILYEYFQKRDNKLLILTGIMFSGLIAVSSSGAFMGLFCMASLLIYFIFKKDKSACLFTLLGYIPILLYTSLIFLDKGIFYPLLIICIISIYYFSVYKLIDYPCFFKVHQVIIIITLFVLIISSYFIQLNSIYPYSYFFNDHSAYDMVHDYFSYYHKHVFYPTLALWTVFIIYLFKNKDEFKKILLILIVFFINPLVTPFIIRFLTNFVFYRLFELIFNLTTLAMFITEIKFNKYFDKILCVGLIILVLPFSFNQFKNNYSAGMIASEDYNPYYRITDSELELFKKFKEILNNERKIVLTQVSSTKAYINNIELVFSVFDTRVADQYNEVKKAAPSELLNIFFPRDFVGQVVYNTLPDYERMNELVVDNHIDYMILRKDQVILLDENTYIELYLKLREIADIVYENDKYVIMDVKY